VIRWFARNGIAANFLMLAILAGGIYMAVFRIPLEITPALSWRTVMIEMPYRGGTAKDVERAILITSITTFVGLAPMIFDRSLEAQFLIPMAVSMGFGILFSTVITLFVVPCVLLPADDAISAWRRSTTGTATLSEPETVLRSLP